MAITLDKGLKLKLITCSPLNFQNDLIYQPTIQDIIELGEDKFDSYLLPFATSVDMLSISDDKKEGYKSFDLLFIKNEDNESILRGQMGVSALDVLIDSLKFFFKTSDVECFNPANISFIFSDDKILQPKIIINKSTRIDRDNFDYLQDLIFLTCQRSRPTFEPEEEIEIKTSNPELRRKMEKNIRLQKEAEEKKRREEMEKMCLANIINSVELAHKELDYGRVGIYKLFHLYKGILMKEQYDNTMQMASSGMVSKNSKLDMTHWTTKVQL